MKLEEVNQRTKEALDFLVAALESGHSAVLTQYLAAMAKFRNYSFGNIMQIARQKPDASHVAGFRTWNSLGRFVKRGEKGILILPNQSIERSQIRVSKSWKSSVALPDRPAVEPRLQLL
jgi:N-terminal domain of anti-restriction factor ArdC